ncbi:S-adenosyl-L-methionine-dependent methyltransferase [Meredithblackwellia eburnea MCA 4105]
MEASTSTQQESKPTAKPRITFNSTDPLEIIASNQSHAPPFQVSKHKKEAQKNWDIFYKNHERTNGEGFFKDRHWTGREWEVLTTINGDVDTDGKGKGKGKGKVVLEAGCGTGAFVYPLLDEYPNSQFHAFDFSKRAVELVKKHSHYDSARVHSFVHDLTTGPSALRRALLQAPEEFKRFGSDPSLPSSETEEVKDFDPQVDIVSCVFVISALPPKAQLGAFRSLIESLTPGGSLLFRDYALHDEAQLRFHALPSKSYASIPSLLSAPIPTASLSPSTGIEPSELNRASLPPTSDELSPTQPADEELGKPWYRRGDSTMVYFFTGEEISILLSKACEGTEFEMVGNVEIVERGVENRKEGWTFRRRFVQGSWRKVARGEKK